MNKHFEGEDLATRVQQLEEDMAALKGDPRLADLPLGTLKQAASVFSLRSIGGTGGAYPAGVLPIGIPVGAVAFTKDLVWAIPFYLPGVPNLVVKMGINVTIADAGNVRLGIYADRGEARLYPGKLLLDTGALNVGSTGVKSATVRRDLPRGLVWIAMLGSSQPTVSRFSNNDLVWSLLGYSEDGATRYNRFYVAQAYGALPDLYPAGATEAGGHVPYIFLKFG